MDDQAFFEELKKDFFEEATSLIQGSEDNILILEKDHSNIEAINEIFRVFHTVKGGAASLELDRLALFTHEIENLLDEIRIGRIKINSNTFDTLLNSIDILRKFIDFAKQDKEPEDNFEKIILEKVAQIIQIKDVKKAEIIDDKDVYDNNAQKMELNFDLSEYDREFIVKQKSDGNTIFNIYINLNPENPMKTVSGLQIFSILKEFGEVIKSIPDIDDLLDDQFAENIGFIFSTTSDKKFVQEKIFISDVTDYIEINEFDFSNQNDLFEIKKQEIKTGIQLSDNEKNEILKYINQGNKVYKISVLFDETNPMRSVSGVLFYSMLEGLGTIFQSNPSLEIYKQDIFIENGYFILISSKDTGYIKEKLYISDITKELKINQYKEKEDFTIDSAAKPLDQEKKMTKVYQISETTDDAQDFRNSENIIHNSNPNITNSIYEKNEEIQQTSNLSTSATSTTNSTSSTKSSILRVESRRVDDLLNLVGELVISKASFFQVNEKISYVLDEFLMSISSLKKDVKTISGLLTTEDINLNLEENKTLIKNKINSFFSSLEKVLPDFKRADDVLRSSTQSFARLTNDLHESVMKLRMVPINQIFNRFPRLVRDLSKTLNKEIELITKGEDTELDKSLVEDLIDPLIHIVRNAVDHGIEMPEERAKNNKPRIGIISLEAEHEGQMISIRIRDDGKGLSKERIRKKGLERGIIDSKIDYSDNDIYSLIFQPGFSTSDSVSQVSGRGVGMDVVKQKVDSLNGTISIETIPDKGTTFIIKLPLTLAIIQALMVEVSDYIYSIPINSVIETIRISPEEIELLENHEIIRVRDEVNSLIHLKEIFNHGKRTQSDYYYVIIVGSDDNKIGLVVDGLIGEQDVVIKPLNSKFAVTEGIAGATILGDGRVSLIIDIPQLIKNIANTRH